MGLRIFITLKASKKQTSLEPSNWNKGYSKLNAILQPTLQNKVYIQRKQ
jgi:hypothetical protein